MLFKIAIKNIKKSIKDYSIYFFTLVIAVSIFYLFNSIDSQTSMLQLSASKMGIVKRLIIIINYVSVFVSAILGFLIIYANNFLIKRRKKEIGLYLTLGMSKTKVSSILVTETFIIGLMSLITGLIFGIVLSQLVSIFTANLFAVNLSSYHFIFSSSALLKTILYYGIIFVLAMIFNIITLSRYKLINLLNASKKNEKVRFRNKAVIIITFILAISLIGYAYYLLLNDALVDVQGKKALIMIICGSVGTFFLFFSLSGFLLKVFMRIKGFYYKDVNMFVLKQVNNKINTTVLSNTIISLMLLLTIGILSTAISLSNAFNKDFEKNNLMDFTIHVDSSGSYILEDGAETTIEYEDFMLESKDGFKSLVKDYTFYSNYVDDNIVIKSLLSSDVYDKYIKEYGDKINMEYRLPLIKESDYQSIMKLTNQEAFDIKDNEYLILANIDMELEMFTPKYSSGGTLNVNNNVLVPATKSISKVSLMNYNSNGNDGAIVVSDNIVDNLIIRNKTMIGNYNKVTEESDDLLTNEARQSGFYVNVTSRTIMEAASTGVKVMLVFIGLYLGIIFAICSATVLSIGQLSESSDNIKRYHVLKLLGAEQSVINKALYMQIGISFMFPLIVAIIHSIMGLSEINSLIKMFASIDLKENIFYTASFVIIIYGGYYLLTCLCSKNIIKE